MKKFKIKKPNLCFNGDLLSNSLIIYDSDYELFILMVKQTTSGFAVCWSFGKVADHPGLPLNELYEVNNFGDAMRIIKGIERLADTLLMPSEETQLTAESNNIYFEEIETPRI